MRSIKIIGAGSIGNHLANAARHRGWSVLLTDSDSGALERARRDIYPSRYGGWDNEIETALTDDTKSTYADVVFVGTPPESHIPLAMQVLDASAPRVLVVEKPLSGPDLKGCQDLLNSVEEKGVFAAVGYNHCLGNNTKLAEELIRNGQLGQIQTISARTREHWRGIFAAHPWIESPASSYLGYSSRGGGATGEHSHAINLWQHFANFLDAGRVVDVSARLDRVTDGGADYDRAAFATFRTDKGMVGDVIQDVVTYPTEKSVRLQGDAGFIEWHVGKKPNTDSVKFGSTDTDVKEEFINKTRADDFIAEIDHLETILAENVTNSPIELRRGLDTLMVIAAMFRSDNLGRRVRIDWSAGYTPDAII